MKTLLLVVSMVGLLTLVSCNKKTDTNALLKDKATRTELFKAMANNPEMMTQFMNTIKDNKEAMQMMQGKHQMMNGNKMMKNETELTTKNTGMMHMMKMGADNRIPVRLSPQKAQHQLINMRSHVAAVQSIINYLSKNEYDKASKVASSKLGLTKEMKKMCTSFHNQKFVELGLGFHRSADKMSEVFKNKDKNKSLEALALTMNYCVTCHSTFKQQIQKKIIRMPAMH